MLKTNVLAHNADYEGPVELPLHEGAWRKERLKNVLVTLPQRHIIKQGLNGSGEIQPPMPLIQCGNNEAIRIEPDGENTSSSFRSKNNKRKSLTSYLHEALCSNDNNHNVGPAEVTMVVASLTPPPLLITRLKWLA